MGSDHIEPHRQESGLSVRESAIRSSSRDCRSVASDKEGKLKPSDVTRACDQEVWWICDKRHAWLCSVRGRTVLNKGCSVCKTLQVRYPLVAKQWHPARNGRLTPLDVKAGSPRTAWWKCPAGHVWSAAISAVVSCWVNHGTNGCQKCYDIQRRSSATSLKGRARAGRRERASNSAKTKRTIRARKHSIIYGNRAVSN